MNDFSDYLLRHPLLQQSLHQPLTEAECDELFALFDDASLPDTPMSAEIADGYLTACAVGPVPVPAHEWMEAIFGQPLLPICADPGRHWPCCACPSTASEAPGSCTNTRPRRHCAKQARLAATTFALAAAAGNTKKCCGG